MGDLGLSLTKEIDYLHIVKLPHFLKLSYLDSLN